VPDGTVGTVGKLIWEDFRQNAPAFNQGSTLTMSAPCSTRARTTRFPTGPQLRVTAMHITEAGFLRATRVHFHRRLFSWLRL